MHYEAIPFELPVTKAEHHWERLLDSFAPQEAVKPLVGGDKYALQGRSLVVLRAVETVQSPQAAAIPHAVAIPGNGPPAAGPVPTIPVSG